MIEKNTKKDDDNEFLEVICKISDMATKSNFIASMAFILSILSLIACIVCLLK